MASRFLCNLLLAPSTVRYIRAVKQSHMADEVLEDALYDSQALQGFVRIDLAAAGVPDATTLLNFRHLLETHILCKRDCSRRSTPISKRVVCCCAKAYFP
jgi:hypothetical protein